MPKPFYLDYLVVLNISKCSGNSQRISLWNLFRAKHLRRYLHNTINGKLYMDFEILVDLFPLDTQFVDVWKSVTPEGQEVFKTVTKEVLTVLRSTGVGEDGYLQAWDVSTSNRLDGRKMKPSWCSILKDDSGCATFAIITDSCMRVATSTPPPSPSASGVCSTFLCTAICITYPTPLSKYEPHIYIPPSSLKGDENRPEWSLPGTTFEKWKVKLSNQPSDQTQSRRRELIDSARDTTGPSREALNAIVDRRAARQLRYRTARPEKEEVSEQISSQAPQTDGTSTPRQHTRKFSEEQNLDGSSLLRGSNSSFSSKHILVDGSLEFKNGKGESIGWLNLDPPQSMNLYTIPEGNSFNAKWEARRPGLLDAIKAKEKAIDKKIVEWGERRRSGVLPWAISRVAETLEEEPFGVEHIRGGLLSAGQKILRMYVW